MSVSDTEIPLEIAYGHVIVEVGVEGLERPLRLILDTGAETVIRSEVLETVNYARDESWSTQSVTDASGMPLDLKAVVLKRVSIGAMDFANVPAAGLEMRQSSPDSSRLETQVMWGRQNGKMVLVGLLKGGAAESAGIRIGDESLVVGDIEVEVGNSKSVCAARRELRRPSENPVKMRLRRAGQVFEVALPREETFDASPDPN